MRRVVIERVEVVVHALDLGPLGDAEAHPDEDVLDLAPRLRQQVQAAGRRQRRGGQRHVDPVAHELRVELGGRELAVARLDQRLQRLARLVGGLADRAALLGRQLRDAAQHVRQLGSAAEEADPRLLQRVRRGGGGDGRLALVLELVDALDHAAPILCVRLAAASPGATAPRVAS
jgi:hypothetical protein